MALTQEDCITAHHAEKKRKTPTGPLSVQPPRYRVVPNAQFRAPQRNAPPGRLVFRPPQQQGEYRPSMPPRPSQQLVPRPNVQQFQQGSSTYRCFNCEVRITLSRIVLGPGSLFKGTVLIRTIRARERSG
jgi:hypothetical protein